MQFTKAEISENGKTVRLTLVGGVEEVYYVCWDGYGKLAVTSCFDLIAVAQATFPSAA